MLTDINFKVVSCLSRTEQSESCTHQPFKGLSHVCDLRNAWGCGGGGACHGFPTFSIWVWITPVWTLCCAVVLALVAVTESPADAAWGGRAHVAPGVRVRSAPRQKARWLRLCGWGSLNPHLSVPRKQRKESSELFLSPAFSFQPFLFSLSSQIVGWSPTVSARLLSSVSCLWKCPHRLAQGCVS